MADGGGCGRGLLACLGAMGGAARSSLLPSHRLNLIGYGSRVIKSAWLPGHPIDGNGFFFFVSFPPDPLPPALLGLLALGLFPPPVPGRGGCAGCGMACGGGRLAACLRSSSPVPLSRCRSFACCYATHVARAVRSCSGCCGAFYGLFYPLSCRRWRFSKHALKWHPVAFYGHFRRCCPLPFLGSPRRLVLAPRPLVSRPLPAAVSWRGAGVFPLAARENGAFAFFRAGVIFRFLRHGMDGVGDVLPCWADGVCGSSCLPLSVRSSPAPWGGGLCAVCGRRLRLR